MDYYKQVKRELMEQQSTGDTTCRIRIFASRLNRFLRYCLTSAALPWISKLISCFKDKTRVQTVPLLLCASPPTAGSGYLLCSTGSSSTSNSSTIATPSTLDYSTMIVRIIGLTI
nr:unnamed protein product [Callosobruchus chinensis]